MLFETLYECLYFTVKNPKVHFSKIDFCKICLKSKIANIFYLKVGLRFLKLRETLMHLLWFFLPKLHYPNFQINSIINADGYLEVLYWLCSCSLLIWNGLGARISTWSKSHIAGSCLNNEHYRGTATS